MEGTTRSAIQLSKTVAQEIRVLLVRREMKQSELAERMGVGEMWLSRRLRGAQPIDLNDLQMIADALNVEAVDLMPRPSEGRLITTAGTRQEAGRSANLAKPVTPVRPRVAGHVERTQPHPSTRRPARLPAAVARA